MTNISTAVKMFLFTFEYAHSPAGVHEFNFAFDLSYDFRSNENLVKRTYHATRFAIIWVAQAAYEKFIETRYEMAE